MTRSDAATWLRERDNFIILTHDAPDGDTLGSAGGLCLGLRALGKTAHVLENPETGDRLAYVCQGLTVPEVPENATVVIVDTAAPRMIPEAFMPLLDKIQLRIDHHGSGQSFAPLELVDPQAASCAEMIYDILIELGIALTAEMAIPLYTGTATDTGCFRYANTNAHTYRVAAACAETGADLYPITQALFDTVSLNRLKLESWVTANVQFYAQGAVAICAMPADLHEELGIPEEEVGGVSGFVRSIEGVKMAATLRETAEGKLFISTRAVPGYNCAAVCERFGGGGHKGAAGAGTEMPLKEAEKLLTQAILEQFQQ